MDNKNALRAIAFVIGYVSSIAESPERDESEKKLANELLNEIITELKENRQAV